MKTELKGRVLSGMRTTQRLHIGNYFGALANWIKLQDLAQTGKVKECYFGAMNWHALTDHYKEPELFYTYIREIISDWIAYGINPEKSILFVQSKIPELLELNMIFQMIIPLGWLDRVTTWKDSIEEMKQKDAHNIGRYTYPVLQTADIAVFKGDLVPVGQDQIPHLELSRELVRRFNFLYKTNLPEPQPILTETPLITGLDGRKMSKSYDNFIPITAEPEEIKNLTKKMVTDPQRVRRTDPGNPDVCPVFKLHGLFTSQEDRKQIDVECRRAGIGCGDCKLKLAGNINSFMEKPLEVKRKYLNKPLELDEIIEEGTKKAQKTAQATMAEVKEALKWNKM